jgi:hypothetical protein
MVFYSLAFLRYNIVSEVYRTSKVIVMRMVLILFCLLFYTDLYSQTDSSFYFPLKSGNLWQYKEPPPPDQPYITETKTGRDTTFSNGQTYRSFITNNYGYPDTTGLAFFRQVGNKVYQFWQGTGMEILRYDFSKNQGDTVSIFPIQLGDTAIVTVLDKGSVSVFGKSMRYVSFYWQNHRGTIYVIEQIVDSIGTIFGQVEPGYQLYLVGAVVDSVHYGVVTNVEAEKKEIPKEFILFQNFPNPFNPSTTIKYQLKDAGIVTLKVIDMLGREVATLVNGEKESGYYSVQFEGSNLSSGVYFTRLVIQPQEGKSIVMVKKILLMK